tara:strand:+ start:275 stop:1261 length:987 start_codon:yes stop_codon:yes gene_type:complete
MDQIVKHFNDIPVGDLKSRLVESHFTAGYCPQIFSDYADSTVLLNQQHPFPFLPSLNSTAFMSAGSADATVQNRQRVKGYAVPGILNDENQALTVASPTAGTHWIWESSWQFTRPVIIWRLDLMMLSEGETPTKSAGYNQRYAWPNLAASENYPPGDAEDDFTKDVSIVLHVDSPLGDSDDRALNAVEIARHRFEVGRSQISQIKRLPTATGAWQDGVPAAFPGDAIGSIDNGTGTPGSHSLGVWEPVECVIPIPVGARVRLSVVIPQWSTSQYGTVGVNAQATDISGDTSYNWFQENTQVARLQPWPGSLYSQQFWRSMTILEEVRG